MKKSLQEDLKRIHTLTYGSEVINEGFLDNILKAVGIKKTDDPKKADLVSDDVQSFYTTLEDAAGSGGLSQQQGGGMSFQKGVESMQIGLKLLGYELPRYGVDGLFGPETASAVSKFTSEKVGTDKKPVNELVDIVSQGGGIIGAPGQGTHNASDWASGNAWDVTGPAGTKVFSITNGVVDRVKQGDGGLKQSGVKKIYGDQIRIKSTDGKPDVFYTHIETTLNVGDSVKEGDVIGTIMQISGMPTHVHVGLSSGNLSDLASGLTKGGGGGGKSVGPMVKATPEMLKVLIDLLKEKGVNPEDLKKNIDTVNVTDLGDKNFYAKLLENLGAPISDENMKFMYAWRQAEGKGGTYNPFNTTWKMPNSTTMNSVGVRNYASLEDGLVATVKTLKNGRYDCIVNGLKNDIGASEIARCESLKTWGTGDLVAKVVNSYNNGANPKIASLA